MLIGATDLTLGERFVFDQDQFDLLCADLGPLQVARAVAASAALPPFFSPITLWNYAGQCGFQPPEWLTTDPPDDAEGRRRKRQVDALRTYLDRETRPYIHILDGGLVDNLGTRGPLDDVATAGFDQLLHEAGKSHLTHAVLVSVDAEPGPHYELNRSADVPGLRGVDGCFSRRGNELLRNSRTVAAVGRGVAGVDNTHGRDEAALLLRRGESPCHQGRRTARPRSRHSDELLARGRNHRSDCAT